MTKEILEIVKERKKGTRVGRTKKINLLTEVM